MKDLHASLMWLKFFAMGVPFAAVLAVFGSSFLGIALLGGDKHYDVLLVLGVTGVVLGFTEWALARRFQAHERVERDNFHGLAMTAEAAQAAALETVRHLRSLRYEVEVAKERGMEVAAELRLLDRRVTQIEERYMRAGILVPPIRRIPEE